MTDQQWAYLISWLGRSNLILSIPLRGAPVLYQKPIHMPSKPDRTRFIEAMKTFYGDDYERHISPVR